MKTKFIVSVSTLFLFCTLLLMSANSAFADWHDWAQWQRNQAIVDRTYQDLDTYVGQSCKIWVQTVIYDASSEAVYPPQNLDYPCTWRTDQPGSVYCINSGKSIDNASPGEIVQMVLSNGIPHTAIVLAKSLGWVSFVESNWYGDNYMHIRSQTITDFNTSVSCYTIYYIE